MSLDILNPSLHTLPITEYATLFLDNASSIVVSASSFTVIINLLFDSEYNLSSCDNSVVDGMLLILTLNLYIFFILFKF